MMLVRHVESKLHRDRNLAAIVMLCLIVMLGAALRLYDLGTESYWFDEIFTVHLVRGGFQELVRQVVAQGFLTRHATYFAMAHFWVRLLGTTEAATRSMSALLGTAGIAAMFAVGAELFGKRVALLSALLMAVSELQIHASQEARFYSLFVLLTLGSFFYHIRALRRGKTWDWAMYVMISVLLFYTHTFAAFVFVAQGLYVLLRWSSLGRARLAWLVSQVLIVLAMSPSLVPIIREGTLATGPGARVSWIPDPTLSLLPRTIYEYVFPLRHGRSWMAVVLGFGVGMLFSLAATLLFIVWSGRQKWLAAVRKTVGAWSLSHKPSELSLLLCWLFCPTLLPFALSKLVVPMYVDKYTVCAAPALYLLLAIGITGLRQMVPTSIVIASLAIWIAPGLHNYYVTDVNEQWCEVAAHVEQYGEQGDVIIFAPDEDGWQERSFRWYYRGSLHACGMDPRLEADDAIAHTLEICTSGYERFWLVMRGPTQRFEVFFLKTSRENMRLLGGWQFTGISLYLFEVVRP